ncbi:hypothetical protein NE237_018607 [Protea cynaroides]|uniref:Uncharacterized protein n=1 Tax=Protea cynaroides TaxID=273540 RepID=A0A9Q0KA55_9MAGN|nr:hypothetical protein NE237_018607 [Protea cynaroides]
MDDGETGGQKTPARVEVQGISEARKFRQRRVRKKKVVAHDVATNLRFRENRAKQQTPYHNLLKNFGNCYLKPITRDELKDWVFSDFLQQNTGLEIYWKPTKPYLWMDEANDEEPASPTADIMEPDRGEFTRDTGIQLVDTREEVTYEGPHVREEREWNDNSNFPTPLTPGKGLEEGWELNQLGPHYSNGTINLLFSLGKGIPGDVIFFLSRFSNNTSLSNLAFLSTLTKNGDETGVEGEYCGKREVLGGLSGGSVQKIWRSFLMNMSGGVIVGIS